MCGAGAATADDKSPSTVKSDDGRRLREQVEECPRALVQAGVDGLVDGLLERGVRIEPRGALVTLRNLANGAGLPSPSLKPAGFDGVSPSFSDPSIPIGVTTPLSQESAERP